MEYAELKEAIAARAAELKGGAGSGNFGHSGRPGQQGGSSQDIASENEGVTFTRAIKLESDKWANPDVVAARAKVPTKQEFTELAQKLLDKHGLTNWKVDFGSYSTAHDAYGQAHYGSKTIGFSWNKIKGVLTPWFYKDLILHEIAHALVRPEPGEDAHSQRWQDKHAAIGGHQGLSKSLKTEFDEEEHPRDEHGRFAGESNGFGLENVFTPKELLRYRELQNLSNRTEDESKELSGYVKREYENHVREFESKQEKENKPSAEELRSAKQVISVIAGDPEALRIAAALAADGSADDVANVTEHLFSTGVSDHFAENSFRALDKIYKAYEKATGENGYSVAGGYHGTVSAEREEWERRWYGKVVGGPSNGVAYAEEYLSAFITSKKSLKAVDSTRRERFDDFLARAEEEGFINSDDADNLRTDYLNGDIADDDLPLLLEDAIDDGLDQDDVQESRNRLGIVALLGTLAARALELKAEFSEEQHPRDGHGRFSTIEETIKGYESEGLGEGTVKTETSVHAFEDTEHFISALESGEVGRENYTSIGSEDSKIRRSYQNQVWFDTPEEAQPVFYLKDDARDSDETRNRVESSLGRIGQKVQYESHKKEQELYVEGRVDITKGNVRALVHSEYATEAEIEKLNKIGERLGAPVINYKDFRENGYKIGTANKKSLKAVDSTRRERFDDFLARAEEEGFINSDDADNLRTDYLNGDIADDDLPLLLEDAIDDDITQDDVAALRNRLGIVALLGTLAARALLRDRLQSEFEGTVRDLASNDNIPDWQAEFSTAVSNNILDQALLGRGAGAAEGDVADETLQALSETIQEQQGYLSRFADDRAAADLLGDPMSEDEIAARSELYSGAGRTEFFAGVEDEEAEDGYVVDYVAVGDNSTCDPCLQAEQDGPYLPGDEDSPYPGTVCDGHGRCRCERVMRYAPDEWAALMGKSRRTVKAEFDEEAHPRDQHGRFGAGDTTVKEDEKVNEIDESAATVYKVDSVFAEAFDEHGAIDPEDAAKELGGRRYENGKVVMSADEYSYNSFDKLNRQWIQGANSDAKYDIAYTLEHNAGIRTLNLVEAYSLTANPGEKFSEWMERPQTLYRTGGVHEPFSSFAFSRERVESATGGKAPSFIVTHAAPKYWLGTGAGGREVYIAPDAFKSVSLKAEFDEEAHPRDEHGRFAGGGSNQDSLPADTKVEVPSSLYHGSEREKTSVGPGSGPDKLGGYFFEDESSASGYGEVYVAKPHADHALDLTTPAGRAYYAKVKQDAVDIKKEGIEELGKKFGRGEISKDEFLSHNLLPTVTNADIRQSLLEKGVSWIRELPGVWITLNSVPVSKKSSESKSLKAADSTRHERFNDLSAILTAEEIEAIKESKEME